jgi:hypothetical protein
LYLVVATSSIIIGSPLAIHPFERSSLEGKQIAFFRLVRLSVDPRQKNKEIGSAMPLTDRDRKLLWARAGGTCAICKSHLTAEAKSGDRDVVLGEEAHIVSEASNGPRYRPMPKQEIDTYANLLLLCPSHHKIVDEQVTHYTEQRLQTLKSEHEQWVKDHVSQAEPAIKIRDPHPDKPAKLKRVTTGKELMSVLAHTFAIHLDNPEPKSSEEAELIGAFVQNATENTDIWDEIGQSDRIRTEFSMTGEITRLQKAGLLVYTGSEMHIIEGGTTPSAPWPIAYLIIKRDDDESIKVQPKEQ